MATRPLMFAIANVSLITGIDAVTLAMGNPSADRVSLYLGRLRSIAQGSSQAVEYCMTGLLFAILVSAHALWLIRKGPNGYLVTLRLLSLSLLWPLAIWVLFQLFQLIRHALGLRGLCLAVDGMVLVVVSLVAAHLIWDVFLVGRLSSEHRKRQQLGCTPCHSLFRGL